MAHSIDPDSYGARFPEHLAPPVDPELASAFAADALASGSAICDAGVRLFGVSAAAQEAALPPASLSPRANPDMVG